MAGGYYPATGRKASRRDFIKLMAAVGTVMTFSPFVDWGKFLPNNRLSVAGKAKVELSDGKRANIVTFPVNHSEVVIYPKTDDVTLNKEAFRTWLLIRLPAELGGETNNVSAFRLYNRICVHLWCIWQYQPTRKIGACPCHGSEYDPATGKAFQGPASLQGSPGNVLPKLDLEADSRGDLWILPPTWDLHKNGIIGFGRYVV